MWQPDESREAEVAYSEVWEILSTLTNLSTLRVCAVMLLRTDFPAKFAMIWLSPMLKLSENVPNFVFEIPPPFLEVMREKRDELGYLFPIEDPISSEYTQKEEEWYPKRMPTNGEI